MKKLCCFQVAMVAGVLLQTGIASAQSVPIFDSLYNEFPFHITIPELIPFPRPGTDYPADDAHYTSDVFPDIINANYPIAIFLNQDCGPYWGTQSPDPLSTVVGYLDDPFATPLNYCFGEFEPNGSYTFSHVIDDVGEMCSVISHSSSIGAHIGNYAWYPGDTDMSEPFDEQICRSDLNDAYLNSAVDIATPNINGYTSFLAHSSSYEWPENTWVPGRFSFL